MKKNNKKNSSKTLIILLLVVIVVSASIFISTIKKPLKISGSEVVNVEEGDSFYSIVSRLSNENKITKNTMYGKKINLCILSIWHP